MQTCEKKDIFSEISPSSKESIKKKDMNLFSKMSVSTTHASEDEKEITISSSLSLAQLVTTITQELSGKKSTDINVERIQTIMRNFDASLGEWKRYAFWDKNKLYTRNLIATDNETFTLMLLCWNPETFSPIHDHAGVECVLRVIQGEIQEKQYEYPGDDPEKELQHLRTITVKAGDISFINDTIAIHSVGNASTQFGATLHCYMPPYSKCRCFLDDTSSESFDAHVSFYSENGQLLNSCGKSITSST